MLPQPMDVVVNPDLPRIRNATGLLRVKNNTQSSFLLAQSAAWCVEREAEARHPLRFRVVGDLLDGSRAWPPRAALRFGFASGAPACLWLRSCRIEPCPSLPCEPAMNDLPDEIDEASSNLDDKGRVVGASKMGRHIGEARRNHETQRLLMREVNHRSKNLLAIIEAMVRQTVNTTAPQEFSLLISGRIAALSLTQDLIVRFDWQGVDLQDLVRAHASVVPATVAGRYSMTGPVVRVSPGAAQALGLAPARIVRGIGTANGWVRSR